MNNKTQLSKDFRIFLGIFSGLGLLGTPILFSMGINEIVSLKTLPGLVMGYTGMLVFLYAAIKGHFPKVL